MQTVEVGTLEVLAKEPGLNFFFPFPSPEVLLNRS